MTADPCEGCGRSVHIAGGTENLWTHSSGRGGGMTLELDDGNEYFLCFQCVEELPEDATSEDIDALEPYDPEDEPADDTVGSAAVPAGLTIGALLGLVASPFVGDTMLAASAGAGVGVLVGLAWPWISR